MTLLAAIAMLAIALFLAWPAIDNWRIHRKVERWRREARAQRAKRDTE